MLKKRPELFWQEQTRCYYVQVGKKQHRLDPDEDTAWRLYHQMMARSPEQAKPAIISPTLAAVEVVDPFLEWVSVNRERLTYEAYKRRLQYLVDAIPTTLAHGDLKPFHISRVMDAKDWSANTKNDFAAAVNWAYNWAVAGPRGLTLLHYAALICYLMVMTQTPIGLEDRDSEAAPGTTSLASPA